MRNKLRKCQKGFTLVELIVVIAILGILAAFLAPKIMGNITEASKQKEVTAAQTIASAITVYNAKAVTYNTSKGLISTDTGYKSPIIAASTGLVTSDYSGLTDFEFASTPIPDPAAVLILTDTDGNAYIEVK